MTDVGGIRGGTDTARVPTPATQAERDHHTQTRADATAYLTRTGNTDLLPVLGLDGNPAARPCRGCGGPITTSRADKHRARYCSAACQRADNALAGAGHQPLHEADARAARAEELAPPMEVQPLDPPAAAPSQPEPPTEAQPAAVQEPPAAHHDQAERVEQATAVYAADVISAYDAWLCERCGARYTVPGNHQCGPHTPPLTSVTVTISRRPAPSRRQLLAEVLGERWPNPDRAAHEATARGRSA